MLFFLILLIVAIIFTVLWQFNREDWISGCAIFACILVATILVIWVDTYLTSLETYGRLAAFQKVKPEYEMAITKTKEAVVQLSEDSTIPFTAETISTLIRLGVSVENFKHSTLIAARIEEDRNYVKWYEETLSKYRVWSSNWFTRQFVAKLPPEFCVSK